MRLVNITQKDIYEKFKPLISLEGDFLTDDYLIIGAFVETKADDGKDNLIPAGIMVCSVDDTDLMIDYINVSLEHRNKGIGTALFEEAVKLSLESEDSLSLACAFDADNEELFGFFYVRPDVSILEDGDFYLITPDDIKKSKLLKDISKLYNDKFSGGTKNKAESESSLTNVTSVAEFPRDIEFVIKRLMNQVSDVRYNDFADIDQNLSQIVYEDNMIKTAVFVKNIDDKNLELSYVMNDLDSSVQNLINALGTAFVKYSTECPEKNIRATIVDGEIDIYSFFPDIESQGGVCVARYNYEY